MLKKILKFIKFIFYDYWVIPPGDYCYRGIRSFQYDLNNGLFHDKKYKFKPCKFWKKIIDKEGHVWGYCKYLGEGDLDDNGTTMLFDRVKECGIKMRYEEYND